MCATGIPGRMGRLGSKTSSTSKIEKKKLLEVLRKYPSGVHKGDRDEGELVTLNFFDIYILHFSCQQETTKQISVSTDREHFLIGCFDGDFLHCQVGCLNF